MPLLPRFLRSRSAAAAVEFAIVMPVFLVVLAGVLVYGLYFGVAHGVQQLAAEAARASIAGLSETERRAIADATVRETIGNYPFLRIPNTVVTGASDPTDPDRFTVTIRYDASHLGLHAFAAILPAPPTSIERRAIVRRGGF